MPWVNWERWRPGRGTKARPLDRREESLGRKEQQTMNTILKVWGEPSGGGWVPGVAEGSPGTKPNVKR